MITSVLHAEESGSSPLSCTSCPYCDKPFKSWLSVRGHISSCTQNTGLYYISKKYGPLHLDEFKGIDNKELKIKYPNIEKIEDIRRCFELRGFRVTKFEDVHSKQDIILSIVAFYNEHKRIPQARDFYKNPKYPGRTTVINVFKTWNNAIEASGFKSNDISGYGKFTIGKDGFRYRSIAEAIFCDKYLFNKYEYIVEPKYPEPYNRFYDWYIPELDIYIELDGGCRPEVIEEKISINKLLGRSLLIVDIKDIYSGNFKGVDIDGSFIS